MKNALSILFFLPFFAGAQVITTIAGSHTSGFGGDGGPATSAMFSTPTFARFDAAGNLYVADGGNARIRVVNSSGVINTFAGGLSLAFDSGDGGQATAAGIGSPNSVATDTHGNVYIATANYDATAGPWLRMVNASGVISTISGGIYGLGGDGGPATAAEYISILDIAVDGAGNIYIADFYANRVRKIDASGMVSTFAGGGSSSGEGIPATSAVLSGPQGLAVDGSGNVYIANSSDHQVRKVNAAGLITTIAGNGTAGTSGDGGAATAAELRSPRGLVVDNSGNIYISDDQANNLRKIDASGIITTIAGTGTAGYSGDGGSPLLADFNIPTGVTVDGTGNIYIVDGDNNVVRKVCPTCGNAAVEKIDSEKLMNVWPSPNDGIFHIYVPAAGLVPAQITVTNIIGQTVNVQEGVTNSDIMLRTDLSPGVYFVNVLTEYGRESRKITVR